MGVQYILLKLRWFKSQEGTLGCLFFLHKKASQSYENGKAYIYTTYYPIHQFYYKHIGVQPLRVK